MSKKLKCEDCGIRSEDVEKTFCPYEEEVYNRDVPIQVCKKCYDERYFET